MATQELDARTWLLPGRAYGIVHTEWDPLRIAGLSLLLTAEPGQDKVWITQRDPDQELVSPDPLSARIRAAVTRTEVRIFCVDSSPAEPARMLAELDAFGLNPPALVLIDGAEQFFEPRQLSTTLRWAEQRACTLVLLCQPESVSELVNEVRPVADRLAGLVRLRRNEAGVWWDTFHWFGAEGLVGNRSYRMTTDTTGMSLLTAEESHEESLARASEDVALALRPAVTSAEPVPYAWRVFDELDDLFAASTDAPMATVLLPIKGNTAVDTLARTVFELRRNGGRRLKIVVRELGHRLRHNQEQLLLRLGANLIIPSEVGISRLLALIETVQGQVFSHAIPRDFPGALTGMIPETLQGYVPPTQFIEAIEGILQQSESLGIQNALVRLPLPLGMSPRAALSFCSMTRPGDISTADDESIYLFLFACREHDVDLALDRLFEIPAAELFEGETRSLSAAAIRRTTGALAARVADLSELAVIAGLGDTPVTVPETPAPVVHQGTERTAEPTPFGRAVRRPLALRVGATAGSESS